MSRYKYIVIAGPTASGKTDLALRLAHELSGEIVNCDSIQVYQELDIGSAKPSKEEMAQVPHHLIDFLRPDQDYDANLFAKDASTTIAEIRQRGRVPIVVGGTGLYLRALWGQAFDDLPKDDQLREKLALKTTPELIEIIKGAYPEKLEKIHANDRFRLQRAAELALLFQGKPLPKTERDDSHEAFKIYRSVERSVLHDRIAKRTEIMLQQGLIAEVTQLQSQFGGSCKPLQSIGYKQVIEGLAAGQNEAEIREKITIATRQYAKRQETWFRKVKFDYYCKKIDDVAAILHQYHLSSVK